MERDRNRWREAFLLGPIRTILGKILSKAVVTCAAIGVLAGSWAADPALAWAPDTTIWTKPLAVKGFGGAYASMLKLGSRVMMYSNLSLAARSKPCPGASCPGIVLYTGNSTTNVTQSALVAPNSMINDVFGPDGVKLAPQRMFTRVSVVRSERDGTFYAIAHVADTYPPGPSGVYPALLTSPNGTSWTYHGKIKGEPWDLYGPGSGRAWANSMAFIVNDEAAGALDTANPLANRFVLYSDGYGDLSSLSLLYSADGTTWYFARTATGAIRDLRPTELMGEQPIFASAVKTPHGYHMITSKDWPVTAQRHLFSCDGLSWALLGKPNSKGATYLKPGGKNTNLSYDPATGQVLALESYHSGNYYAKKLASFLPTPVPCP
jgi:hypothetical protein